MYWFKYNYFLAEVKSNILISSNNLKKTDVDENLNLNEWYIADNYIFISIATLSKGQNYKINVKICVGSCLKICVYMFW